MNIREALIQQAPSLELQRAAQAEIARLDAKVLDLSRHTISQRNELEVATLRTAVEALVAERDAMKAAHEAIATLDHTRPLLDARGLSRTALRGQP